MVNCQLFLHVSIWEVPQVKWEPQSYLSTNTSMTGRTAAHALKYKWAAPMSKNKNLMTHSHPTAMMIPSWPYLKIHSIHSTIVIYIPNPNQDLTYWPSMVHTMHTYWPPRMASTTKMQCLHHEHRWGCVIFPGFCIPYCRMHLQDIYYILAAQLPIGTSTNSQQHSKPSYPIN